MNNLNMMERIKEALKDNEIQGILPWVSSGCTYTNDGVTLYRGKEEIVASFEKRKMAIKSENVPNFVYIATVYESKVPGIAKGDKCIPIAQYDRYNCVGFFVIQIGINGMIDSFDFYTTPDVMFSSNEDKELKFSHVPRDAHDAIGYRAIAFGVINDKVIISKHIQRYEQFPDCVERVYKYINKNLFDDFNHGISNAAGYLYVVAMSEAVKRRYNIELIRFDESNSILDSVPIVEKKYQSWINCGYEMGTRLFFGFIEYVNLRKPKDLLFDGQLQQSFMDMMLYGSTQANRDMDQDFEKIICDIKDENPDVNSISRDSIDLRKAMNRLSQNGSPDEQKAFAIALTNCVDNSEKVYLAGNICSKSFEMKIIENQEKKYVSIYFDSRDKSLKNNTSVVLTSINALLNRVFYNTEIEGVQFNDNGICLYLNKGYLLKCILHGRYPQQNNSGIGEKDWGHGIPKYKQADIMTEGQLLNFAMNSILDNDKSLSLTSTLISGCDCPGVVPSFIFEREGMFSFVQVIGYIAMKDEHDLTEEQRKEILRLGNEYNASCYYAKVGFGSCDQDRFEEGLALQGDGYYCKYDGLKQIT